MLYCFNLSLFWFKLRFKKCFKGILIFRVKHYQIVFSRESNAFILFQSHFDVAETK